MSRRRRQPPTRHPAEPAPPPLKAQRLDKWIWCVRITRTRAQAARLIEAGAVRVNREKVLKPAAAVRPGDVLTIARAGQVRVYRVLALAERRMGAALVSGYREEL